MYKLPSKLIFAPRHLVVGFADSQRRSLVSATRTLLEKRTINVPTMGDSITEGTVVEWAVQPGQAVELDDVVAMVETDKVTVEIKAEIDGVLTNQFCNVDDTVAVGSPLYEIDTEAEASVVQAAGPSSGTSSPVEEPREFDSSTTPPPRTTTDQSTAHAEPARTQHRTPSIQFLGKDGWALKLSGSTSSAPEIFVIPPMYGRPAFTEAEMEALILGGASLEVAGYSAFKK